MTEYDSAFTLPVAFAPVAVTDVLGEVYARAGLTQLRLAETEKYAHVTYFFNGGVETQYQGEERLLVPSPKDVATYDLKPEMSARIVTQELLKKAQEKNYKLIVVNFANGDMVGHTGVEPAAVKAIEVLDQCLGEVTKFFMAKDYDIFITADHGNSECMVDPKTGAPHTAHTTNPVPLYWISNSNRGRKLKAHGVLADIAPTILKVFGWEQPKEMTGQDLILN
jgi:2,3-bisphosphoglycerate-independent phosphoglycerate mutase